MIAEFQIPTKIISGSGSSAKLGGELRLLGATNVMLVADPAMEKIGLQDKVVKLIEAENIKVTVFNEIEPDPTVQVVHRASEVQKAIKADVLVALGGGSAIDTAKAISVLATHPGGIEDYCAGIGSALVNPLLPLVAIPTTAGTGSEVTSMMVVINMETKTKFAVRGPQVYPDVAILDPDPFFNLPPFVIAYTGLDALTHAIETYTSNKATELTSALALRAISLMGKYLPALVADPGNLEAADNMLFAANMAGTAFDRGKLHLVHALSHALGGYFRIAHGIANGTLLPYVMQWTLIGKLERYRDVAIAMGKNVNGMDLYEAAQQAVVAVKELNANILIPSGIGELGVADDEALLEALADKAVKTGLVGNSPRKSSAKDLVGVLRSAL
jgi:alcohol dehydrogenase class IV